MSALPVDDGPRLVTARSEVELVADAVWRLVDAGVIHKHPQKLLQVARLTGLELSDLRAASTRLIIPARYQPPRRRIVLAPTLEREERPTLRPPTIEREVRDGRLRCPRHDGGTGAWVPIEDFAIRVDQKTERRKSWCRSCVAAYQRTRYLSAARMQLLADGEVATLETGDPLLKGSCPSCRCGFKAGEAVRVVDVRLAHADCSPAAP